MEKVSNSDFFKNARFTEYKKSSFNGYPSAETSFSLNFEEVIYKGKFLAFKSGSALYLIMYMGDGIYNNGVVLQNILASVKVD